MLRPVGSGCDAWCLNSSGPVRCTQQANRPPQQILQQRRWFASVWQRVKFAVFSRRPWLLSDLRQRVPWHLYRNGRQLNPELSALQSTWKRPRFLSHNCLGRPAPKWIRWLVSSNMVPIRRPCAVSPCEPCVNMALSIAHRSQPTLLGGPDLRGDRRGRNVLVIGLRKRLGSGGDNWHSSSHTTTRRRSQMDQRHSPHRVVNERYRGRQLWEPAVSLEARTSTPSEQRPLPMPLQMVPAAQAAAGRRLTADRSDQLLRIPLLQNPARDVVIAGPGKRANQVPRMAPRSLKIQWLTTCGSASWEWNPRPPNHESLHQSQLCGAA